MLILSSRSIYSRIALFCSSIRALLVDPRVLFDFLLFHRLCNRRTETWYTVATCAQFEYQPSWIASHASILRSSIAEYELKAMLLFNYTLIVTCKNKKIRRWDQHDVEPVRTKRREEWRWRAQLLVPLKSFWSTNNVDHRYLKHPLIWN